jgi:outer membrane protein insertion porin family
MPLDKAKPTTELEYSTKDSTKFVLASRFQAGYIAGKAPFLEQFRLGGLDTIRGYEDEQFPGVNKLLINTELRYQPAEVIQLAAFADYGDAWGGDFSSMVSADSKLRMRLGYGVGIRVMVPMLGPIRFDYGFTSKGKNRFIFGIGSIY